MIETAEMVKKGIVPISAEMIATARQRSQSTKQSALIILEETLGLPPDQFIKSLAAVLQYPMLDALSLRELQPAFDIVSFHAASQHHCLLLRDQGGALIFAIADPFDDDLLAWAHALIGKPFITSLIHASEISAFLIVSESHLRAMDAALPQEVPDGDLEQEGENISLQSIAENASPVVKLVNSSLFDALKVGASDIHLESHISGAAIKYRIDGVLSQVANISDALMAEQVISRIKVMAELDIAERRTPQDGRFRVVINGREVDFRVSIMPCVFGEDAVLRILDRQALTQQVNGLRLESLGFDKTAQRALRRFAKEPHGMVLVTGPTGSGKTTTLYALISEINQGHDKIITIEDPVEYQLAGVTQIPVNERKGLTFAKGLRSILRHDPDKILVGEIRDTETAQIAVQSALTGHLVFTTLHANNVFDVIGRFMHMGVDPYSFVSALNGILAQRLLRVVCPHCATSSIPNEEVLEESGISSSEINQYRFVHGTGCGNCRGSGYKGRKAIAEILYLNDEIRRMIAAREPVQSIKAVAYQNGTRLLREAALELVRIGETSLEEANRVTSMA